MSDARLPLPRELVLASAGTGKTFRISSRIIGLLALGTPPDEILASTFTRKAAGEILNRVLSRLAEACLDPVAARELGDQIGVEEAEDTPNTPDAWQAILSTLLGNLHRLNVGTLDALFVRVARSFQLELGLPPGWGIGEESRMLQLEAEALQEVLAGGDPGERVELVRMLMRGDSTRRVHSRLLENARDLRRILRRIDPSAPAPWRTMGAEGGSEGSTDDVESLAANIESAQLPLTARGKPHKSFVSAVQTVAALLRSQELEGFAASTLCQRALEEEPEFSRKPFTPELLEAVRTALAHARRSLAHRFGLQIQAMERLAKDYDGALAGRQRERGAYRFQDIEHLLGSEPPLTTRRDLWYRLDQMGRHLLLDEFQDTSRTQWHVLEPLVKQALSTEPRERSVVMVADPKQSIYGWRGAEPDLVRTAQEELGLRHDHLAASWRSSDVILRFVNQVVGSLPENPAWGGDDALLRVAREWSRDFLPHVAAREGLPGYLCVAVGPRDLGMQKTDRPLMMRHAARLAADLNERAPGASIGILVRHNEAVARLIAELRALGVRASEEGGTRPDDSAAVSALLAALTLSDHPSHTIARYHVSSSPLGRILGYSDHSDDAGARVTSQRIRRALLADGYGATLAAWVRALAEQGSTDARDLRRLLQLVELGYRWDPGSTLRPTDFVEYARASRLEDPESAPIRVMTVHQAKGLEFDLVILPEMDVRLEGSGGSSPSLLTEKEPSSGRVTRVFPYLRRELRPLFPEVAEAVRQGREATLRDALGILYVGLTRARHALHVLVAADDPDRGPSASLTYSHLLREALGRGGTVAREGQVLHEAGTPDWHRETLLSAVETSLSDERPVPSRPLAEGPAPEIRTMAEGRRRRFLPHRTPASLEGGGEVDFHRLLDLDTDRSRARGLIVHGWLQRIGWLEDGLPSDELLQELAAVHDPLLPQTDLKGLGQQLHEWLQVPSIRSLLSRATYPAGTTVRNEVSFAYRSADAVIRGQIDRLVLLDGEHEGTAAEVIDFKTDRAPPGEAEVLERLVRHYTPQIQAYREAVAATRKLDPSSVRGRLVFLSAGVVRDI